MAILDTFDLTGKVAVVTGANQGLGRAFARGLGEAGAKVAVLGRTAARNEDAAAELVLDGIQARAFTADVIDRAGLEVVADAIEAQLGPVDILVNNAGTCIHRPAFDVTDDEFAQVMNVNVTGVWNGSQVFGKRMAAAGHGVIVNVGSISGQIVNRPQWQPAYNASKAAVHQLTKSLAAEWAPLGIRVNAIALRSTSGRRWHRWIEWRFRRYWIEDAPQQRAALPEEIAPTVVFLASDASAFMTGSVLVIDGGYTLY